MSKIVVQIPTNIVRNEDTYLNCGEFSLYVRLSYLYFRNYQDEHIRLDHKKLMCNTGIHDTRTFKKRMNNLHRLGLIKGKIERLPRRGTMEIVFNGELLNNCDHFTQMNVNVFKYMDDIGEYGLRMLFYYKSYINTKDKTADRSFCYVGYDRIASDLKVSSNTIDATNKQLQKCELLKIVKHKLEPVDDFGMDDELQFDRFNNHYYLNTELF